MLAGTVNISALGEKASEIYTLVEVSACALAAVALAACAVGIFLSPDERGVEKSRKAALLILAALAAIFILPAVVSLGRKLFEPFSWNPEAELDEELRNALRDALEELD